MLSMISSDERASLPSRRRESIGGSLSPGQGGGATDGEDVDGNDEETFLCNTCSNGNPCEGGGDWLSFSCCDGLKFIIARAGEGALRCGAHPARSGPMCSRCVCHI